MKASKFTDAQKAFIIRQGDDGTPVEELCRKAGISQATYYAWKKKYAGMMPSKMKRTGLCVPSTIPCLRCSTPASRVEPKLWSTSSNAIQRPAPTINLMSGATQIDTCHWRRRIHHG